MPDAATIAAKYGGVPATDAAAVAAKYGGTPVKASDPGSKTALGAKAASMAVPSVRLAAEELATNPNVPRAFASAGRVGGALGSVAGGVAAGEPIAGVVGAAKGAWLGGKTGWFTGKLAQNVAAPIAKVLTKVEPAVKAVASSAVMGAQAGLDLAQALEPNRRDIGVFGIGKSVHVPDVTVAQQDAMFVKAVKQLMTFGAQPQEAAAVIARGNPAVQDRVLAAYVKAEGAP